MALKTCPGVASKTYKILDTRVRFVGVNTDCPLQSHKPNISYLIPANNDSTSDLKTFFSLRYIDDQKKLHG